MNRHHGLPPRIARPAGFTLIELLVTITIIGILAAIGFAALTVSQSAGKEAATKATIAKLHNIIMAKYDSYRTRRVPLTDAQMQAIATSSLGFNPATMTWSPRWAALVRLAALRDLMRMEMPERWTDIWDFPTNAPRGALFVASPPNMYAAYVQRCSTYNPITAKYVFLPSIANSPAKCLYLIVTMAGGEEARRQFHDNEIAQDSDGFSVFVDGWGHPIYFLRWAPGFNDSELQGNIIDWVDPYAPTLGLSRYRMVEDRDLGQTTAGNEIAIWNDPNNTAYKNVWAGRQVAARNDHDPFDPWRVSMLAIPDPWTLSPAQPPPAPPSLPRGWRLVPLIFSPGPDGEYGIAIDYTGPVAYSWMGPDDHYLAGLGLPVRNAAGAWVHTDNIHNHRLETR